MFRERTVLHAWQCLQGESLDVYVPLPQEGQKRVPMEAALEGVDLGPLQTWPLNKEQS